MPRCHRGSTSDEGGGTCDFSNDPESPCRNESGIENYHHTAGRSGFRPGYGCSTANYLACGRTTRTTDVRVCLLMSATHILLDNVYFVLRELSPSCDRRPPACRDQSIQLLESLLFDLLRLPFARLGSGAVPGSNTSPRLRFLPVRLIAS